MSDRETILSLTTINQTSRDLIDEGDANQCASPTCEVHFPVDDTDGTPKEMNQ